MPKNSLTKIQLAEAQKTFGSPKILKNLGELKTHHKTYEALSAFQVAVENNNMKLANELVEKTFVKLKTMKLKKAISATEFKKYLNNKSQILQFTRKVNSITSRMAEIMKYEGLITKTYKLVNNLNLLYRTKKQQTFVRKGNELKEGREKFKEAYKKMMIIMNCADIIGEFAPAGISEYIEFNVKFFKNAEVAIVAFDRRAAVITKKANSACKSAREKCYGKGSEFESGKTILRTSKYGVDDALDKYYKTRRYRKK